MSMPGYKASSEGLNTREKTIINFLSDNPGVTKQKVVDALDEMYSRVTVFDTIRDLERYGMIIVQKDKPNTRIHNLYINKRSQIIIEMKRLSQFEIAMTDLLEKIQKISIRTHSMSADDLKKLKIVERIKKVSETLGISINEKEKILKSDLGSQFVKQVNNVLIDLKHSQAFKNSVIHYEIFFRLLRIFWYVMLAYSFKALFIWPFQGDDKLYSNKLLQSVLDKLIDIQMKMAQILNDVSSDQGKYAELLRDGFKIDHLYTQLIGHLKKEINFLQLSFEEELKVFRKHGLAREIKTLLDSVYPITKDIFESK